MSEQQGFPQIGPTGQSDKTAVLDFSKRKLYPFVVFLYIVEGNRIHKDKEKVLYLLSDGIPAAALSTAMN